MRLFLLLFLFTLSTSSFASSLHVLNDSISFIDINVFSQQFSSKDQELSIQDVLQKSWETCTDGSNFGVTDRIHWIKYDFSNEDTTDKQAVLYFPYHHINVISVYQVVKGNILPIQTTGTSQNYYDKNIVCRGYPIRVDFPSGQSSIIIKLEHLYLPLRGTVYLLSESLARDTIVQNGTLIWFWRGIFMFALFISLILFLSTRNRLFLYYFLLNIGVALFIGMELGDFFLYFNADPYNFIIDIKHLGNILIVLLFPLFLNELTPLSKLSPRVWKFMIYGVLLMGILWALCLIPALKDSHLLYYTTLYFIYFSGLVFLLQLYFLSMAIVKKQRNSVILLITYFFYITAVVINVILPNLGYKNDNLLVYNTLMYGSIFEIFTFMILMGRETFIIYQERSLLLEKQKNHQAEIIKAIVESQEIERNKVGRELHDMIGANISVIKQNIDKTNKSLVSVIDNTVDSVRSLSHGLVTPLIKDDEFVDEVNELCLLHSTEKMKVAGYFHSWKAIPDPQVSTHLFRVVQELLQNAVKHSNASYVDLQFLIDELGMLTLMYEDNGKGFDFGRTGKSGVGLINIENRVLLIGGTIQVDSSPNGKGTTIIIEVPKSYISNP